MIHRAARVAALLCLPLGGCGTTACAAVDGQPGLVAELLFGLSRHDGSVVGASAWQDFLAEVVTPRFPLGLTVFDAQGQWPGPDGRLSREPSKLVLIAADSTSGTLQRLQAIRDAYRARFAQDSVGLLLRPSCNAF